MNATTRRYGLIALRALLTLAFGAAGTAKLFGVPDMVAVFDAIGWGQWFRYLTGVIEVAAAILLWVPGRQALAAAALVVTMIGAVIAHLAILGPSAVPALVLGLIAVTVLAAYRDQLARQ
ncbi:MAG: DoxX family protein [Rhodobacteraceae bacterium]|nr:DoxX family protein [Alphaproteobacteria bacterium]MBT8476858.1 DoxX family protein [Alphaproteobacteria bacterium]NNK66135.1 DoxX family protein [Paracoccaceae bacterium]